MTYNAERAASPEQVPADRSEAERSAGNDQADSFVNDPTPEGRALGRELARMADREFAKDPNLRPRCHDCAFTAGTAPNSIAGTLMTALKCALERDPFYCHVIPADGRQRLCAGWQAMLNRGEPVRAPWSYLEPAGDPLGRCVPEIVIALPDQSARPSPSDAAQS